MGGAALPHERGRVPDGRDAQRGVLARTRARDRLARSEEARRRRGAGPAEPPPPVLRARPQPRARRRRARAGRAGAGSGLLRAATRVIECVPNFSDGRDPAVAAAIRAASSAVPGVKLLGWHSDADHNRSVATFVGEPRAVEGAAYAAIARAAELIDLTRHD